MGTRQAYKNPAPTTTKSSQFLVTESTVEKLGRISSINKIQNIGSLLSDFGVIISSITSNLFLIFTFISDNKLKE